MGIPREDAPAIQAEFARRRKRQYLIPLVGLPAFFVLVGAGLFGGMAVADAMGWTRRVAYAFMAAAALIVIGAASAFSRRNLRCPSCDRSLTAIQSAGGSPYWSKGASCQDCGCKLT